LWSDPIENALANVAELLKRLDGDHAAFTMTAEERDNLAWVRGQVARAKAAREFERREDRLVTPQDRF
jgi:hypothetical protein